MNLFFSDLDNTLIYSYKQDLGRDKVLVETKEGKALSYMTGLSFHMLQQVRQRCSLIPVTTRSLEQYRRISLFHGKADSEPESAAGACGAALAEEMPARGSFVPEYALVSNGGILLRRGEMDPDWYTQSLKLTADAAEPLRQAEEALSRDPAVYFEIRMVDGLFLFTKSNAPEATSARLRKALYGQEGKFGQAADDKPVEIFENGEKIYVIPRGLDKGAAVRRLLSQVPAESSVAAGDSSFDLPMLAAVDLAYVPEALKDSLCCLSPLGKQIAFSGDGFFSDWVLRQIISTIGN